MTEGQKLLPYGKVNTYRITNGEIDQTFKYQNNLKKIHKTQTIIGFNKTQIALKDTEQR